MFAIDDDFLGVLVSGLQQAIEQELNGLESLAVASDQTPAFLGVNLQRRVATFIGGLLDVHHEPEVPEHVGTRENVFCLLHNFRAGFDVVLVRVAGTESGIRFHQNGMTMFGKFIRTGRQQRNALLLFFDLPWDTDDHLRK